MNRWIRALSPLSVQLLITAQLLVACAETDDTPCQDRTEQTCESTNRCVSFVGVPVKALPANGDVAPDSHVRYLGCTTRLDPGHGCKQVDRRCGRSKSGGPIYHLQPTVCAPPDGWMWASCDDAP